MASKTELKVIGAGFGRTGTTSLQKALEILGVGPCYHLNEIIDGPDEQVQVCFEVWRTDQNGRTRTDAPERTDLIDFLGALRSLDKRSRK